MRRLLVALALVAASGCGSSSTPPGGSSPSPSASAEADVLPAGKGDLPVTGTVYSPLDFVPPLRLTVPDGWTSTHRGDDAFDLSRPDPTKDAPLVVVAFVTPQDATAKEALETLESRLGKVTPVRGTLGGAPALGFDVVGGTGTLVESPSGTLTLDRQPSQRARVLAIDVDDVPLLVVIAVPDGSRFTAALPDVEALLAGVLAG